MVPLFQPQNTKHNSNYFNNDLQQKIFKKKTSLEYVICFLVTLLCYQYSTNFNQ